MTTTHEEPDPAAVLAANADASRWYRASATRQPLFTAAVAARGLTPSQAHAAGVGWAPDTDSALTDHLIRRGHRLPALRAAGLSVRRGPRHHDVIRGRITFAYRDRHGQVLGFTARTATGADAKWINTRTGPVFDKSRLLYGAHAITDRTQAVAIVEGAWDAATVTATTSSRIVGVAACGTGFTADHAHAVNQLGLPVIVATDADPAGRAAAVRIHQALVAAGVTGVGYLALPDGHDPSSWHTSGHDLPAALAAVSLGSLTRHVIDTHRHQLTPDNGLPAQLAHVRQLARALSGLPPDELADAIAHLADITGLMLLTIYDVVERPPTAEPQLTGPPPAPPLSARSVSAQPDRINTKE